MNHRGDMTTTISKPTKEVIQGLWIGSELSTLERLSIASFLACGHEYVLYTYGCVRGIPEGTAVRDGNEILDESLIFQYRHHQSFSAFANFFRYKLLLEKGGWWVDMDTVCLKPFDFSDEYVFSSEILDDKELVNCGVVKAPAGSPAMSHAWSVCRSKRPENLVWGEVGPRLMAESVDKLSLQRFVMKPGMFCPINYLEWETALNPATIWNFSDDVYAVHLWNEMWRRNKRDKNQAYHPDCLYERLKSRFLGTQHRSTEESACADQPAYET
jgi:Glycosyltransferase sugar-binding region containing DXD motif/Alpha 1,4-glycosyltransferase conserved region